MQQLLIFVLLLISPPWLLWKLLAPSVSRRQATGMEGKKSGNNKSRKAKKASKDRKSKVILNLNRDINEDGNDGAKGDPEQDAK